MKDKLTTQDLALYLGCEVEYKGKICTLEAVYSGGVVVDLEDDHCMYLKSVPISKVKPILRPLSDMTQEEAEEHGIKFGSWKLLIGLGPKAFESISGPGIINLIRQGFDVFGWIENGLAVDKTKLK